METYKTPPPPPIFQHFCVCAVIILIQVYYILIFSNTYITCFMMWISCKYKKNPHQVSFKVIHLNVDTCWQKYFPCHAKESRNQNKKNYLCFVDHLTFLRSIHQRPKYTYVDFKARYWLELSLWAYENDVNRFPKG